MMASKTTCVREMKIAPLLRWAGSKRKLLPELLACAPQRFRRYVEPFAGSACLFFSLAPERAILGDFNEELIDFYGVVSERPTALFRAVSTFPVSETFYYELREWRPSQLSRTQAAARFLYLNRFCFNGVYRTNKAGQFNVPFGRKTGTLPTLNHLISASKILRNARFAKGDFTQAVSEVRRGDFVYMDPPYSAARYRGEYGYGAFSEGDLERLVAAADYLHNKGATFLISYKHEKAVTARFDRWFRSQVTVRRHVAGFAGARRTVTESLFSNRPLQGVKS